MSAPRVWIPTLVLVLSTAAPRGQDLPPQVVPAPGPVLAAVGLNAATLQDLSVSATATTLEFLVELDGRIERVVVAPHDLRAAGFAAYAWDAGGLRALPPAPSVTWKGTVAGRPGSEARVGYWGGGLRAVLWLDRTSTAWGIEPLHEHDATAPPDRHVVYRGTDAIVAGACGVAPGLVTRAVDEDTPPSGVDATRIAEIAIECDAAFTALPQIGGSTATAQFNVTQLLNAVEAIFDRDTQIQYSITSIIVNVGSDPYSTVSPISASTLLGQFQTYWRTNRAGVQRDVAHLFSGRDFASPVLGIANRGTVCSYAGGYSTTEHYRAIGSFVGRVGLVTHELAHNWNAIHCSSGSSDCRIMCATFNGCAGDLTRFGQTSISAIIAFKNTRTCLTVPAPPVITSVTPSSVPALNPNPVAIAGTNLSSVTEVRVFASSVPASEFVSQTDTLIRFFPPRPLGIGGTVLWVVGSAPSNVVSFTYTEVDPPALQAPAWVYSGPTPIVPWELDFGGAPGDRYALFLTFNRSATVPILGIDFLAGSVELTTGSLDGVGLGSFGVPLPVGSLAGITLVTQVVMVDPGLTRLRATNLGASFVVN